ncbi:hypothetical protein [Solobacterium moorei]|jgi:hypothetical protein|uniref:MuF-C-terminal domain-containing protein n=2 Tax=Solobacterium TaxID=123375 RepID=UPI001CB5327D|nr:hypothetical protein [Solobacterium moorei]MBF1092068.1 hypothetical protein [Solobacterium sp.]
MGKNKWNKQLLDENGKLKTWEKQLLEYEYGLIDDTFLIVHSDSKKLAYTGIDDLPITIKPSVIRKLKIKHNIPVSVLVNADTMLENTLLGVESKDRDDSIVFLLDKFNSDQYPIIAVIRKNQGKGYLEVNEVASIYDKKNFENYLNNAITQNKKVWINPDKKREVASRGLQLPLDILSPYTYDIPSVVHNQVEKNELPSTSGEITKASIESSADLQLSQETIDALSEVDYSKASGKSQIEGTTSELEVIETQQEVVIPVEETEIIEESNSSLLENVSMEDDGIDFD